MKIRAILVRHSVLCVVIVALCSLGWIGVRAVQAQATPPPQPIKIEVENFSDEGSGSLRDAIKAANDAPVPVMITFNTNVFGHGQVINLASELPPLNNLAGNPISIDGWSAGKPDYKGGPLVTVNGTAIKQANGLTILSKGNTVRGLAFGGFNGIGLYIHGSAATGNWVYGNDLGADGSGASVLGNQGIGLLIDAGASSNVIGTEANTQDIKREGNVIVNNGGGGLVLTDSGTTKNIVSGNFIGLNALNVADKGNMTFGVLVEKGATDNVIGAPAGATSTADTYRNIISGNLGDGLILTDAGTTGNLVSDNFIGLKSSGQDIQPNTGSGIVIRLGAQKNTVGSQARIPDKANVISGNAKDGIDVTGADTAKLLIDGNLIGTDAAGSIALGNRGSGLRLNDGTHDNVIGLCAASAEQGSTQNTVRNLIAGNGEHGLVIQAAQKNCIGGNAIGVNANGTDKLPNAKIGVNLLDGAQFNIIGDHKGGSPSANRNVISGNDGGGIALSGQAHDNQIAGNYIGTDGTGTKQIGNGGNDGVLISDGAQNNIVGIQKDLPDAADRNVISGNLNNGIHLIGAKTTLNVVSGNFIGTDVSGTRGIPNKGTGVLLENNVTGNFIGDARQPGDKGNLISGNASNGVGVVNGAAQNVVSGNYIGTDVSGTRAIPNLAAGIRISDGAQNNVIGITDSGAGGRNLISGNNDGIILSGTGTNANVVAGNYIGITSAGNAALGNSGAGVRIEKGAQQNTVGIRGGKQSSALERNIISGNHTGGVTLINSDTNANIIAGNYIGTDAAGLAAVGNTGSGILLDDNAASNRIGTAGKGIVDALERNIISANSADGVTIQGGANNNQVAGNHIGANTSDSALGNKGSGVVISAGQGNLIGGSDIVLANRIRFNGRAGLTIQGSATLNNTIQGNTISRNAQDGIVNDKAGGALSLPLPKMPTTNVFISNLIDFNGGAGFYNRGSSPLIDGNTISNNAHSGIFNTVAFGGKANPLSAADDLLATPLIGATQRNAIYSNCTASAADCAGILSVDTQPLQADTLEKSNPPEPNSGANFVEQRWYAVLTLSGGTKQPTRDQQTLLSANGGPSYVLTTKATCPAEIFKSAVIYGSASKLNCADTTTWTALTQYVVSPSGVRIAYSPQTLKDGTTFNVDGANGKSAAPAEAITTGAYLRYWLLSGTLPG